MANWDPIFYIQELEFSNLVNPQPRYNESCDSIESGKKCEDRCLAEVQDCIDNCADQSCNPICQRDFFTCIDCKYDWHNTNRLEPNG